MKIQIQDEAEQVLKAIQEKNQHNRLPKNIWNLVLSDLIQDLKPEDWDRLIEKYIPESVIIHDALMDEEIREMVLKVFKKKKKNGPLVPQKEVSVC